MRKRWFILAALAGALAVVVVGKWLDRPRWRSGPGTGHLNGFSPDGQIVVTSYPRPNTPGQGQMPDVSRRDAATGKLLGRTVLHYTDLLASQSVHPSADGRLALVCELKSQGAGKVHAIAWHLHDAVTGRRIAGPIPRMVLGHSPNFSLDNRWFWGIDTSLSVEDKKPSRLLVFDAATGEPVLELANKDGQSMTAFVFAPDGASAAAAWMPRDRKTRDLGSTVQILELPSGRELRRIDLPSRRILKKWDGRYLEVHVQTIHDSRGEHSLHSCRYDLASDPIGAGVEEPLLSGHVGSDPWITWLDGMDWVAHMHRVPAGSAGIPSWYQQRFDQLARMAGFRYFSGGVRVSILDRATGASRSELPQLLPEPCAITPDGRLLACPSDDGGIEVWDIEPAVRWPWLLAAGTLAAGTVLALGYYRRPHQGSRTPMQAGQP